MARPRAAAVAAKLAPHGRASSQAVRKRPSAKSNASASKAKAAKSKGGGLQAAIKAENPGFSWFSNGFVPRLFNPGRD